MCAFCSWKMLKNLRDMLQTSLSRQGIIVDPAPTLAIAREAVLSTDYDAIVLDRTLPDGEGLTLLADLKARPNRCPVIVLSALGTGPADRRSRSGGG